MNYVVFGIFAPAIVGILLIFEVRVFHLFSIPSMVMAMITVGLVCWVFGYGVYYFVSSELEERRLWKRMSYDDSVRNPDLNEENRDR